MMKKIFVFIFSLWMFGACEEASFILDEEEKQVAFAQVSEQRISYGALLEVQSVYHSPDKIVIGWNLPSGAHLVSLVIKNEWDGSILNPGLMEYLPIEIALSASGTYSITLSYKYTPDLDVKSETVYYHYEASNPSASGIVNEVQKPQCSHDFSGLRPYAFMQISRTNNSYMANFDISYTGNVNFKAILTDSEGHKLAERTLENLFPTSQRDTTLSFNLYTVGSFVLKIYSDDCPHQSICTDYLYINFHNTVIYAMGDIEYFLRSN